MKKGKAAGIAIAVIAVAIVFGIASLPDEVLLETPMGASENAPAETFPTEFEPEIISSKEESKEPEVIEEPPEAEPEVIEEPPEAEPEVIEETPEEAEPEEESEGNVIEVKIRDGVGSADR